MPLDDLVASAARQTLSEAIPVSFAAVGEVLAERSGVVNIGIEGSMLVGALAGAWFASHGGVWAGLSAGMLAGGLAGAFFAWLTVVKKCDQIIAGLGVNLLCIGLTGVISHRSDLTAAGIAPPAWTVIAYIDPAAILALATSAALWVLLFRSSAGLSILAVGENPAAADTAGISVGRVRFCCVLVGAALAGVGGAYLSIVVAGRFQDEMTSGRGFLALALVILGRWSPVGAVSAAAFFGLLISVQQNLQPKLPADRIHSLYPLLIMSPYVLTLVVLAGLRSSRAPAALGTPYHRQ